MAACIVFFKVILEPFDSKYNKSIPTEKKFQRAQSGWWTNQARSAAPVYISVMNIVREQEETALKTVFKSGKQWSDCYLKQRENSKRTLVHSSLIAGRAAIYSRLRKYLINTWTVVPFGNGRIVLFVLHLSSERPRLSLVPKPLKWPL